VTDVTYVSFRVHAKFVSISSSVTISYQCQLEYKYKQLQSVYTYQKQALFSS